MHIYHSNGHQDDVDDGTTGRRDDWHSIEWPREWTTHQSGRIHMHRHVHKYFINDHVIIFFIACDMPFR